VAPKQVANKLPFQGLGPGKKHKDKVYGPRTQEQYVEHETKKAIKKSKKKKKEKKKEGKESHWWDTLLEVGGGLLLKFLPMLFGGRKISPNTVSFHSGPGEGMIGAAQPTATKTSGEPIIKSLGPGRVLIEHTGLVGSLPRTNVTEGTPWARGDALFKCDLTPLIEPWLTRMSAYQRYRFRNIAFTMIPTVPTVEAGRVMGAFEVDVDAPIMTGKGETTMKTMASLSSAIMVDVWSTHVFVKSFREDASEWYYVSQSGVEPRTNIQGRFTMVAADVPADWAAGNFADLLVSYQIELDDPILTPAPNLGMFGAISSGANVSNTYPWGDEGTELQLAYYTDSVGEDRTDSNLPVVYTKTLNGTLGSFFKVPRGNYMAMILMSADADVDNIAVACRGSYKELTGYESAFNAEMMYSVSLHMAMKTFPFSSSGFNDADGLSVTLSFLASKDAKVTGVSSAYIQFVALGGSPRWVNPLTSTLKEIQAKIQALANAADYNPTYLGSTGQVTSSSGAARRALDHK